MFVVQGNDIATLLVLFLFCLPIVALFFNLKKQLEGINFGLESYIEKNKLTQSLLFTVILLFVVLGYLAKPVYYTLYASGVVGDSLIFAEKSLEEQFILDPRHFSNPFLPQLIVKLCLKAGLINPQSYFFKEQVYLINTFPMRIFASLGIICMFFLFRNILLVGFLRSLLAALFLGTSFVYWLWGIYNNTLAIALGLQVITIFLTFKAIGSDKAKYYFLSALAIGFVIFAHAGSAYFCAATVLFVIGHQIWKILKARKNNF